MFDPLNQFFLSKTEVSEKKVEAEIIRCFRPAGGYIPEYGRTQRRYDRAHPIRD